MRYLDSWKHLFRKRHLSESEAKKPATKGDVAHVSDQTLKRMLVLVGLILLFSGSLYWSQGHKQHQNDLAISNAQLENAQRQRQSSINGCRRQNQLRSVDRDNLKAQHRSDRANRKLFRPEQFGLTLHQFNSLIKQADAQFRHALHRLHPVECVQKYPRPRAPVLSGE